MVTVPVAVATPWRPYEEQASPAWGAGPLPLSLSPWPQARSILALPTLSGSLPRSISAAALAILLSTPPQALVCPMAGTGGLPFSERVQFCCSC